MQQELVAAREAASERQSSLETTRAAEAQLQSALAHARAQLSDERGASMRLARSRRRELLACAPTGSGKTAAFLIPLLVRLGAAAHDGPRALLISPTQELFL